MIDNPEFELPFRFTPTGAAELEQGSAEEIQQCVYGICCFRIGERLDLPDFGIPDDLFRKGGTDLLALEAAIIDWEPRAQIIFDEDPNWVKTALETITIRRDMSNG